MVVIDGKTLRRSFDRASAQSPLHMLHAWSGGQRLLLGQFAVEAKSNEITAVPKLLEMLSLKGCIVTADALNCQRATAAMVIEQGADHVLARKANQPTMHADVRRFLNDPQRAPDATHRTAPSMATMVASVERMRFNRTSTVCTNIDWLQEMHAWPGLAAIGKVERIREIGSKVTSETACYLLSTPLTAEHFGEVMR